MAADKNSLLGGLGGQVLTGIPRAGQRPAGRQRIRRTYRSNPWLIVHAGSSEIVQHTADSAAALLDAASRSSVRLALEDVTLELLLQTRRALFIVGTLEGGALAAVTSLLADRRVLSGLEYVVLGIEEVPAGAGLELAAQVEGWLHSQGALPRFPMIGTPGSDLSADLALWHANLVCWLEPSPDGMVTPEPASPAVERLAERLWRMLARLLPLGRPRIPEDCMGSCEHAPERPCVCGRARCGRCPGH